MCLINCLSYTLTIISVFRIIQTILEIYTYACCITEYYLGILRAASFSRFKLYDCIALSL